MIAAARRIAGAARQVLRLAVRTRFAPALLVLTVAIAFGLPAAIRGDGTPAGALSVRLQYPLVLAAMTMGAALLALACASISMDIEGGQMRLIRVKPVHALELWLGRWLGLALLAAVLLAIAGLGAAGQAGWAWRQATGPGAHADARLELTRLLTPHDRLVPREPDVRAAVRERMDTLRAERPELARIPASALYGVLRRQVLVRRAAVAPGAGREWIFDLPAAPRVLDGPAMLRVRVAPGHGWNAAFDGDWQVSLDDEPPLWTGRLTEARQGVARLELPRDAWRPGAALRVRFANPATAQTVVFDVDNGVEMLAPNGGFVGNLVRVLLMLWCRLSLLIALGLAAGTLFSLPVALFVSGALIVLVHTGHYVVTADLADPSLLLAVHGPEGPGWLSGTSERAIRGLEWVAAPALTPVPATLLADGLRLTWGQVLHALLRVAVLPVAVLALVAAGLLERRELAAGQR